MTGQFQSAANYYARNQQDSSRTQANPAIMHTPDGDKEPAVILSQGRGHFMLLNKQDAYRVAKQIADILTKYRS